MWKAKSTAIHSRATNQARAQQECSRADVMIAEYLSGSQTAMYLQRESIVRHITTIHSFFKLEI